jgi:hypothetical protein
MKRSCSDFAFAMWVLGSLRGVGRQRLFPRIV